MTWTRVVSFRQVVREGIRVLELRPKHQGTLTKTGDGKESNQSQQNILLRGRNLQGRQAGERARRGGAETPRQPGSRPHRAWGPLGGQRVLRLAEWVLV